MFTQAAFYINHTGSTSTITCVRGILRAAPTGKEFDSLDAMMRAYAEEAVRLAAEDHGMTLDYSPVTAHSSFHGSATSG